MKFGELEYIVWSWPWQILGAICAEARAGDLAEVLFFLSGKQCTILPISGQPDFTKFAHRTWFCDVVNPFRIIFFENLPLRGLFSKKNRDHRQQFPTSSRDFSEMITNLGKSWQVGTPMECWLSTVPLESTQSHSRGQQSPYEKGLSWTSAAYTEWLSSTHHCTCRTAMQLAHAALTWHYIIIKSFAGRQHHLDVSLLLSLE